MYFGLGARSIAYFIGFQLAFFSLATTQASAGLHFTSEEVVIWKSRKDNGPYKEDWNAIFDSATTWKNNPGPRFTGWTSDTCFAGSPAIPGRTLDDGLRDAAFVYLVTGNISYRDSSRDALLAQAKVPGTDFSNMSRWCPTITTFDQGYGDNLAPWVRKLVYAYSYIRESLSGADKNVLDTWFLNAGKHFDTVVHNVVRKRFPNRDSDGYSSCSTTCPGTAIGVTHYGGPTVYSFGLAWNNKGTSMNATVAAIGVLLGDAKLITNAKRYIKEWIKYGTYPGGQVMDQFRWGGGNSPQHGFLYSGATIGSIVSTVDHIARAGDISLYNFETSDGMYGSQGGPKSLKRILAHFAAMSKGSVIEYASNVATSDPGLIIDPENQAQFGQTRIEYVNIVPANVYYKDPTISAAYQLPIPTKYSGSGCDMLQGDWCTYPRIRFMFGQMEGKVWPYGSPSVFSPTNLLISGG